jgi:hypothetical protein
MLLSVQKLILVVVYKLDFPRVNDRTFGYIDEFILLDKRQNFLLIVLVVLIAKTKLRW